MAAEIYYGTSRRVITPCVPASLAGYFNIRMYTKVFDDLEVRALVLGRGEKKFLLLQFDLITVTDNLYNRVLEAISPLGCFTEENVLLTATHAHTGPDYRPSSQAYDVRVLDGIVAGAVEAVREASSVARRGFLYRGVTRDDRFEFNRRYWMKNGKVVTNPGKLNPEIDRPEGECDYEIPLLAIKNESGAVDVLLANIVNHTDTIGGCEVSADWAGFMHRKLESQFGAGSMVFPLIGCSGNINHFDTSTSMCQTCYAEAERIGLGYAETVEKALASLVPVESGDFKILHGVVEVGPCEVSDKERTEALAVVKQYADVPDPVESGMTITSEDLANGEPVALKYFAQRLLEAADDTEKRVFRLTGLDFGEVVIASLPSEPFVEIGLELRKRIFRGKECIVVSHGNGTGLSTIYGGYIPNPWNYGRGGYETEPLSNPFARDTAVRLIEGWEEIIKSKRK